MSLPKDDLTIEEIADALTAGEEAQDALEARGLVDCAQRKANGAVGHQASMWARECRFQSQRPAALMLVTTSTGDRMTGNAFLSRVATILETLASRGGAA